MPAMSEASGAAETQKAAEAAGRELRSYLEWLNTAYPERQTLVHQAVLALLSREHLLIFGPPGTGKSELAAVLVRSFVDEQGAPSVYSRQIVETTVQTDLVGPVDFKTLTETGRTVHHIDEGILAAQFAVLDEVFDGRDLLLRSILSVLNERSLALGASVHRAKLQSAFLTTNRYLSEVLAARPDTLQAFADRIAFAAFVPRAFADPAARTAVLVRAISRTAPERRIALAHLLALQQAVDAVQVPRETLEILGALVDSFEKVLGELTAERKGFVPTTHLSPRTLVKAVGVLRSAVVYDRYVRGNDRPLRAGLEDLAALQSMFCLGGPEASVASRIYEQTRDPRERWQIDLGRLEASAFERALGLVVTEAKRRGDSDARNIGLADLRARARRVDASTAPELVMHVEEALRKVRSETVRDELLGFAREAAKAYARAASNGNLPPISIADRSMRLRALVLLVDQLLQDGWTDEAHAVSRSGLGEVHAALESVVTGEVGGEFEIGTTMAVADLTERCRGLERQIRELCELGGRLVELVGAEPFDAREAEARRRAANAVRRRAMVHLGGRARQLDGWRALGDAARALERLDVELERLSPGSGKVRSHVLAARAGLLLSAELSSIQSGRVAELAATLDRGLARLDELGIEYPRALRMCRPVIERFLLTLEGALEQLVVPRGAPSENGYLQLVARCRAAETRRGLARVAELMGFEQTALVKELDERLAQMDLMELRAQVDYLSGWLAEVIAAAPAPESLRTLEEAEAAWAKVSATRFFAVGWRDRDISLLQGRVANLAAIPGLRSDAEQLLGALHALATSAERFGSALLERRAELATAA